MTSATEELRRMLDERGVEWQEHRHVMPGSMAIQRETLWGQPTDAVSGKPIPHVYHYRATEMGGGRLFLEAQLVSPEQAVAVTCGAGTCRALDGESSSGAPLQAGDYDEFWEPAGVCSECGELIPLRNYCPNCGRRVIGDVDAN